MKIVLVSVVVVTLMVTPLAGSSASAPAGPPAGLTLYGLMIWNLDALVRDTYGGRHACLRQPDLSIHRCSLPIYNDGDYRVTFASSSGSGFKALSRSSNPLSAMNVVPLRIGRRYVLCGANRWLGITNAPTGWGEAVACVRP